MTSPILGEFLGTMMLVLLGNGVVAGVLLKRSKAEGGGWPVIAAGWAFAVMAGSSPPSLAGAMMRTSIQRLRWFSRCALDISRPWLPTWRRSFPAASSAPRSSGFTTCRAGKRLQMPRQNSAVLAHPRRFAASFRTLRSAASDWVNHEQFPTASRRSSG